MSDRNPGENSAETHEPSHGGRPQSWFSVGVVALGFVIGGIALCLGPAWPLFWAGGVGLIVLGSILMIAFGVFGDVVVDEPRVIPEIVHYSLFGKADEQRRGGEYGETLEGPTAASPQVKPHG